MRLKELHDRGVGRGDVRKGLSTREFFERFDKDRVGLEGRLATVRYTTKLFVHRNNDRDPTVVSDLRHFNERRLAHLKRFQQHRKAVAKKT
jgi:hypothetical protein